MAEQIILDGTAISTGRSQLDITTWIGASGSGIDWGDAEIQAYMSDSSVGSSAVDYRIPNRQVSIPLTLRSLGGTTFATIRSNIQQKVGLFQREGGWLQRNVNGTTVYADIVNATLHLGGSWQQAFSSGAQADIDATLQLECIPDWYGDEITLGDHVETTLPHLFFTETNIQGNHPGRVRLVVDNDDSTFNQTGMLWGFRSRHYDGTATAALFYEAESLVKVNGAVSAALSGASGGTAVTLTSPPSKVWVPTLNTQTTAGSTWFTHTGSYRVWARCYSANATPSFRLQWGAATLSTPITNNADTLGGTGNFYMLDLGPIRVDAPPVGANRWQGNISTYAQGTADSASIDAIYLQPLDESAGKLTSSVIPPASSLSTNKGAGSGADNAALGSVTWTTPTGITAPDYPTAAARADLTAGGVTSHYLVSSSHGFALPAGGTVLGIRVDVLCLSQQTPVIDNAIRLVKAGSIQTGDLSSGTSWPTTWGTRTYGGPTTLWGSTWLATDINNAGFGVAISAKSTAVGFTATLVDYVNITVYYTLASGFTIAADAVTYASQSAELRTEGMYREDSTGSVFGPVSKVIGDLPRIPPSGTEARTVQTFLKMTRGDFDQQPDTGIDDLSARITYRPSFLITP